MLVYHFMYEPDYEAGCPSCAAIADGFDGFVVHLAHDDVALSAVSRAPLAKLQAYKRRMRWMFPWASRDATRAQCTRADTVAMSGGAASSRRAHATSDTDSTTVAISFSKAGCPIWASSRAILRSAS